MPGMDESQTMVIHDHKLNQIFIPIVVAGPDVVFLVDWLLVWQIFYLYLIKNIRNTFLPSVRVISTSL